MNGICFLEPHAALATCNLEGRIAVWRMGPAVDPLEDYRAWDEDDGGSTGLQGLKKPSTKEPSQPHLHIDH